VKLVALGLAAALWAPRMGMALGHALRLAVKPASPERAVLLWIGSGLAAALGPIAVFLALPPSALRSVIESAPLIAVLLLFSAVLWCVAVLSLTLLLLVAVAGAITKAANIFLSAELAALSRAEDSTVVGRLRERPNKA
jgi:hypothetical protein